MKEVKDVLSYWRLIVNPSDDASLRRIINWPSRGIGKTSIEAFSESAFKRELPIIEALALHGEAQIAPKSLVGVKAFRDLISSLQAELAETAPTPEAMAAWARRSLEKIGARKAIEEECDDAVQAVKRWENLDELLHSLGQMKWEAPPDSPSSGLSSPSTQMLQEFLSRLTLQAQEDEDDKKENAKDNSSDQVTLLTLHGAKGLEYPMVFLVGMEEGIIPHRRTIEEALDFSEERRLCYVGITRARDHLILTRCRNRVRFGKPVPRLRSRFLEEIPASSLDIRDESHGPDRTDSIETRKCMKKW